jgi:hypothetical protein
MTHMHAFCAAAALSLACITPASSRVYNLGPYQGGAAAAQYNYERYGETGYARDGDVRNTCVKLCRRDTNPCDPPEFKAADGRCNPFD